MRFYTILISFLILLISSCQQEFVFENSESGELLVQEKLVYSGSPSDSTILRIERDANKRWIRIIGNQSGYPMDYEVKANRDPSGKITSMRTIDQNSIFGVYDTAYQTLFYQGNSNILDYFLSEDKDGNGLPRVDSFRYFYNAQGRLSKYEYHSNGAVFSGLYLTTYFEYDGLGNITQLKVERYNPTSTTITNYEYDLTKKSPIQFTTDMEPLLILPEDYFSPNVIKKRTYNGQIAVVDSVNFSISQFNSFARPVELAIESNFLSSRRYFLYE